MDNGQTIRTLGLASDLPRTNQSIRRDSQMHAKQKAIQTDRHSPFARHAHFFLFRDHAPGAEEMGDGSAQFHFLLEHLVPHHRPGHGKQIYRALSLVSDLPRPASETQDKPHRYRTKGHILANNLKLHWIVPVALTNTMIKGYPRPYEYWVFIHRIW